MQVLVVDELGDQREAMAVKSVAHRGVCMVATAHGACLSDLLKNSELNVIVGGVGEVIVGDMERKAQKLDRKTVLERKGAPVFSTLVEVLAINTFRIHRCTA